METFVRIKGILLLPTEEATYKSMSFSVEHDDQQQLFNVIDKVMMDVVKMQGLSIITDENKVAKDPNNMQFWPMNRFHHIEVETKRLSAPVLQGTPQ